MQKIIRLGDSTSHGGKVVSATSHMTVGGIPIARLGDKCTCPKRGHNNCVIVEGDPNWTVDGIPVALEGHKTSCGAVLVSSAPNTGREDVGGIATSFEPATSNMPANLLSLAGEKKAVTQETLETYNQHFLVINNQTNKPLAFVPYRITLSDGRTFEGVSDDEGKTELVSASSPLNANIEVFA